MTYAEVLLPLPLTGSFTYEVPEKLAPMVRPGHRVVVPFGSRKFYTGIVLSLTPHRPSVDFALKEISQALDTEPIVRHPQLKLWQWIADYYLCSAGEVLRAALPAGLKPESETAVELNADYEETADNRLTEREAIILQLLDHAQKRTTLADLDHATGFSNLPRLVASLLDRGAIRVSERLVERYHAKTEAMVALTTPRGDSEALARAFDELRSAPKQEKAYLALVEMSGFTRPASEPLRPVTRAALMERVGVTAPIIDALKKRGLVEVTKRRVSRFGSVGKGSGTLPELSEAQGRALNEIFNSYADHDVTLLHGVTSSGKTELYIHLIDNAMRQGRQALFLVPEIALTTQLTGRLQRVFGDRVVIYHSKFSDNERVELWRRMLRDGDPCVVIGARSAIFLPFSHLGLVIVDEEHESSYKQQDPAPRYNGRDAALVLARMHGAKALLGSATPAIDTYWKAKSGRYGLVSLTERFGGVGLPQIELIDMEKARKQHRVSGSLSLRLEDLTRSAVDAGNQAILFLNRRGFAPVARCRQCAHVPHCRNCDVALTYHKGIDRLTCHYCGAVYEFPRICPSCHEPAMEILGYGTERVEDEIAERFPVAPIARLDLDSTRNKDAYQHIIDDFSARKSSILIGTQMVTKGLDFEGVSVVGVVNADTMIHQPDFRATERAFNMMEQVAGRAGRRETSGIVAVQTYTPAHPVFNFLLNHDYEGFYNHEIEERRLFNYPPFTRLIYIYLRHADAAVISPMSAAWAERLRVLFGNRVAGPDEPRVARVQNMYIRRIMLKIEVEASMTRVKQYLRELYEELAPQFRGARVHYDVDPC